MKLRRLRKIKINNPKTRMCIIKDMETRIRAMEVMTIIIKVIMEIITMVETTKFMVVSIENMVTRILKIVE